MSCHATSHAKLPRLVVTRRQHALPHRHRHILQLRAVELLDTGVEGIAVHVDDVLRQVSFRLKLGNLLVRPAELGGEVARLEMLLAGEDGLDFPRQLLVPLLLVLEKPTAAGGLVDDFGDFGLVDGLLPGLLERGAEEGVVLQWRELESVHGYFGWALTREDC